MLELQVIGRLGKDAEIKNFNGRNYISFNVASSETYKDASGVKREITTWVSCLKPIKDGQTPAVAQYLLKGTQVFVRGDLYVKTFNSQNGVQASVNCRVSDLQLVGGRSGAQQQPAQQPAGYAPAQAAATAQTADPFAAEPANEDENLPF